MAPISCRHSYCNATFSTTANRNKYEKKTNHYPTSPKAREHNIPYDEAGKIYKCKNKLCKAISKKKSNIERHIKICSSYSAKTQKRQNDIRYAQYSEKSC